MWAVTWCLGNVPIRSLGIRCGFCADQLRIAPYVCLITVCTRPDFTLYSGSPKASEKRQASGSIIRLEDNVSLTGNLMQEYTWPNSHSREANRHSRSCTSSGFPWQWSLSHSWPRQLVRVRGGHRWGRQ